LLEQNIIERETFLIQIMTRGKLQSRPIFFVRKVYDELNEDKPFGMFEGFMTA